MALAAATVMWMLSVARKSTLASVITEGWAERVSEPPPAALRTLQTAAVTPAPVFLRTVMTEAVRPVP